MDVDQLHKRLLERFKNSELAHFYLLRPHPHEVAPQEALETWVESFLQNIWELERQKKPGQGEGHLLDHPDFLVVKNPKPSRAYQSTENPGLIEWYKTQDYGPMEFKRRWVVIHHADTLTESFCHKQLKTLEEPNDQTTIIFTDPLQSQLLKTIESRAIKIQIPKALNPRQAKRSDKVESFGQYLESLPAESQNEAAAQMASLLHEGQVHKTLEWLKNNPDSSRNVLEWVLDFERSRCSPEHICAISQRLRWFEKSAVHHNAPQERWLTLLSPYL